MSHKGGKRMVVYWDLVAIWNFLLDYILLLGATRLAGLPARRGRLALAAGFGAVYAAAQLALPYSPWALGAAMLAMCALAFGRTERFLKLTLLFALLACGLGGGVVLLGNAFGSMKRLARGVVYAQLPWGVFLAAAGLSYLLLAVVFRNGARHGGEALVRARVEYGGKRVTLTLLRDTGNTLEDPLTGEGVPVVYAGAVKPLFSREMPRLLEDASAAEAEARGAGLVLLRCGTVGAPDTALPAFRCDALTVDGKTLGARLIAVTPYPVGDGGGYQGLWCNDRQAVVAH